MNTYPIGIFDSGVGGLSVYKEIISLLPNESIVYLADSKNCPYGTKSKQEIIDLSVNNTLFLLKKKCKIIVVACNTATAAAIDYLRNEFDVEFIGMEPAVKPAAISTKTKSIGILATEGTFNGKLFKETSNKFTKGINLHLQIGHGLVDYVESGDLNNPELRKLLEKYLEPMKKMNVDNIVLGCTHYPFLKYKIQEIIGNEVKIIDPAPAIARRVSYILNQFNLSNTTAVPLYHFYTTGNQNVLNQMVNSIISDYKIEKINI